MAAKFKVGDSVKSIRGFGVYVKGIVEAVIEQSEDLGMLWGSNEPHYRVKDDRNGLHINVIERGIEKYEARPTTKRRRSFDRPIW